MSEDRFRIVGPRDQYEQVYFVRQDADGQCLFAREEDRRYAAKLTATEAIEWCKHLRGAAWPQCRVISMDGSTMFSEDTALAPTPGDGLDRRNFQFYEPNGFENTNVGYVVAPATTPELGRCWACRCQDQPSLNGRIIGTVYDLSPEQAVLKFLLICKQGGVACPPSPRPDAEETERQEALRVLQDIKNSQQDGRRTRPGDRQ
jgi:hypothetical protein